MADILTTWLFELILGFSTSNTGNETIGVLCNHP